MIIKSVDIERRFDECPSEYWCKIVTESELTITFQGSLPETYKVYKDIETRKTVNLDCSYSGVKINKPTSNINLSTAKVIYQDDVTVLKINGKAYTAKPEKGERFDPEKGLLVCLVKALGLTTSDVLDLYGRAVIKKSKGKANIIKQDKTKKKTK